MRTILVAAFLVTAAVGAGAGEWQVTTVDANNAHPAWCGDLIILQSDREGGVFQIWGTTEQGESFSWHVTNQSWMTYTEPSWNCAVHMAAFQGSSGGDRGIYVVYDSGPSYTPILAPYGPGDNEAPSYLGGHVAFHSDREGQDDAYLVPEGGADRSATRLTTNPAADRYPAISPGGQWIAFASDRSGDFDIWVTGPAGEADTLRQITSAGADDSEPAWSPGGTHIAFARSGTGIVVVDLASRTEFQVTSNGADSSPAWSPEGDIVAFTRHGVYDQVWCSDNLPPGAGVEKASWGSIKALYR
jgi:Tol biopolymer transport system component